MNTASHRQQAIIAGRARRIGWPVETNDTGGAWLYRITRPDGVRIQLHKSPSDVNWQAAVLKRLNGPRKLFDTAEHEEKERREKARQARLAADLAAGQAAAARTAAKAATIQAALTRAAGPHAVTDADPAWILTPHDLPEIRHVIIGPDLAAKILDNANTSNRHFRPHRADEFAQIIRDGEWAVTHQGIAIDTAGTLQDGQHRLAAIRDTGSPQPLFVTVGMPPSNFTKVDTALLRTARDALGMRGETNVTLLAAVVRLIVMWDRYGDQMYSRKGQKVSIDAIDRFTADHAEPLRAAVRKASAIRQEIKIIGSGLAAAIFLIGRAAGHDNPHLDRFVDDLETGTHLDRTDPVYTLRRQILRPAPGRGNGYIILAQLIKCWNHRVRGNTPHAIVWRTIDAFPTTILIPENPA